MIWFTAITGVVLILLFTSILVARLSRKPVPSGIRVIANSAEPKEVVDHARNPCVGRRRPCVCGARWPAGTPRAGLPKSVKGCCGRRLVRDPRCKGHPLPLRLVLMEATQMMNTNGRVEFKQSVDNSALTTEG